METEIIRRKENPIFGRIEVEFRIKHPGESTPNRAAAREEVARIIKADKERVIIDHMSSEFGKSETVGYAKVYESKELMEEIEEEHLLKRHAFVKKKESAPKKESEEAG